MHSNSLNDLCQFINEQSYLREELGAYLSQSAALIKMTLHRCFQQQEDEDQHDYLWAINNLVASAKIQNEAQIKELMAQAELLEELKKMEPRKES